MAAGIPAKEHVHDGGGAFGSARQAHPAVAFCTKPIYKTTDL
jgi:hypothetical protein